MFRLACLGILSALVLAASCGKSGSSPCPGLCPVDSTHPTMTIEVAGGAPVLKGATLLGGPCSRLLVPSYVDGGGPAGYAAVQVTYNGPTTGALPLCLVEVTTVDGQSTQVTAEAKMTRLAPCCPKGSCCATAEERTGQPAIAFKEPVQTVSFAMVDGGTVDGAAIDAGVTDAPLPSDGGALDATADATVIDTDSDASLSVDADAIDARTTIDSATLDVLESGVDL